MSATTFSRSHKHQIPSERTPSHSSTRSTRPNYATPAQAIQRRHKDQQYSTVRAQAAQH